MTAEEVEIQEPEEVLEPVEEFEPSPPESDSLVLGMDDVIAQVIAGEFGTGQDRRRRLAAAGYNHIAVQKELVRRMNNR